MKRRQFISNITGLAAGMIAEQALAISPPQNLMVDGEMKGPKWFANMPDHTWLGIADPALGRGVRAVAPSVVSPGGYGVEGICTDWTGGACDIDRSVYYLPAQGGHNGYRGNEVYALDLKAETPAWKRETEPGFNPSGATYTSNNTPQPTHQQNQLIYVTGLNEIYLMSLLHADIYGNSYRDIWSFNVLTKAWSKRGSMPNPWGDNGIFDGGSIYDPKTGAIFAIGTQNYMSIDRYDIASNTHILYEKLIDFGGTAGVAFDANRRCIVVTGGRKDSSRIYILNVDNPSAGWTNVAFSGQGPSNYGLGFQFHEKSNSFLAWNGGTNIYKLTPSSQVFGGTWTWTTITASSGSANPGFMAMNGTHRKFQLVPNLGGSGRDALVMLNNVDNKTYVYKLP